MKFLISKSKILNPKQIPITKFFNFLNGLGNLGFEFRICLVFRIFQERSLNDLRSATH